MTVWLDDSAYGCMEVDEKIARRLERRGLVRDEGRGTYRVLPCTSLPKLAKLIAP